MLLSSLINHYYHYFLQMTTILYASLDSDVEKEIPRLPQGIANTSSSADQRLTPPLDATGQTTEINPNIDNPVTQTQSKSFGSSTANKPIAMVEPLQQQLTSERGNDPEVSADDSSADLVKTQTEPKPKFDLVAQLKTGCILTLVLRLTLLNAVFFFIDKCCSYLSAMVGQFGHGGQKYAEWWPVTLSQILKKLQSFLKFVMLFLQ